MKVSYMNVEIHDDFSRVTFVGYDKKGRRRSVIDLSATDFANLVSAAKTLRARQKWLSQRYANRAEIITTSGVTE